MTERPMPRMTSISRPFWEGCDRGALVLQRCLSAACRQYVFYPRVCCPHCGHGELEWTPVCGRGTIVSYTKVHRPQHDSFRDEVPIYFLAVALEEGPLVYSRLAQRPQTDDGLMNHAVRVTFAVDHGGQKLPYFELT
jgi:uncharacterized OB-fold protein